MAIPSIRSAGTGAYVAAGTASTIDVPYPASITAGDLLIMQFMIRSTPLNTVTTPAGWTLQYGPEDSAPTPDFQAYTYVKTAAGSESGNLTVTCSGTDSSKSGRIYAIQDTNGTIEGAATRRDQNSTVLCNNLTTSGDDRLGVALVYYRDVQATTSFTTESGGDWTEAYAYSPAGVLQIQTAQVASATTITGGSLTYGAYTHWITRSFALQPAAAAASTAGNMLLLGVS